MSVRYKIILSLLFLTATCLGIYIWIAKTVFENDKEVAIFESETQTGRAQAFTLKQHLDDLLLFSNTVVGTLSPESNSLSSLGNELFEKKTDVMAFGIWENGHLLFFQSKDKNTSQEEILKKLGAQPSFAKPFNNKSQVIVAVPLKPSENQSEKRLIVVVDLEKQLELLSFSAEAGGSFLVSGVQPISAANDFPFNYSSKFLSFLPMQKNMQEQTSIEKVEAKEYLISVRDLQFGDLRIYTIVPKAVAFMGLGLLYRKSMQFFGLIFFVVLGVSVLMTARLLKNLDRLGAAANKISEGDFDVEVGLKSNDEFGKLANSFHHMSQEIKRLIIETKEKSRMETELKTAQAVQENLFPVKNFKSDKVEISGLYRPASECGGDWWYHFEHPTGVYVFICDATGHGAPAALITAAAKAAVNLMRRESQLNLQKLVTAFNYTLFETANGKLMMTGFVFHIKPDQTIEYINASHESPLLCSKDSLDFISEPIGFRFGQSPDSVYEVGKIEDFAGKFLLLYTDGINGQKNPEGKELGDRRFMKHLKSHDLKTVDLEKINKSVFSMVDEFRKNENQADDLTIVSVRFST